MLTVVCGAFSQYNLYTWGQNYGKQLGDPSVSAFRTAPGQIGNATNWAEIASGYRFNVAIKSDGTLWAWGLNTNGQLGDSTYVTKDTPVQIGNATNWAKVACGEFFTLAIKTDGTLWSWGYNASGQLGDGTNTNRNYPRQVGVATYWAKIACGQNHSLAITTSGILYAFGDNTYYQLGDGTNNNRSVPTIVNADLNWAEVSAGRFHSIALKTNGTLYAWGENLHGQLGTSNNTNYSIPTQVGTATNWTKIASGETFNLAIRADSTLWGWGSNGSGQLGDNYTATKNSPTQISSSYKWLRAICGGEHTIILRSDSSLWGCGNNVNGQLGDGTNITKSYLVQVGSQTKWAKLSAGAYHTAALKYWSPISAPTLLNPQNNLADAEISITFRWNRIIEATQYRLQISTSPAFDSFFANTLVTSDTFKTISGLANNTLYYWRVCAKNENDSSAWSSVRNYTTVPLTLAEAWSFTANTGYSANIGLKAGGTFTIGTRNIQSGDAIGAFYSDGINKRCAGYFVWDNVNRGFVVWADDEITSDIKEGFALNEKYTFKVWDGTESKSYPATFTVETGGDIFTYNGITVLSSLVANKITTQRLSLPKGWNMVSSYVIPTNDTLSNIVSALADTILFVKNFEGQTYWPQYMNSLTNWNYRHAYTIKTSDTCTLGITGYQLNPDTTRIYLSGKGWRWIPYYRDNAISPALALSNIANKYILIKSIDGKTYWPGNMFTLTNMEPGKGYMIYMKDTIPATDTLIYPPNNAVFGKIDAGIYSEIQSLTPSYFVSGCSNTGNSAVLSIKIYGAEDGDEVGIYSESGLLVGTGIYENKNVGLTIWGDDFLTENLDGAKDDELLKIRIFKPVYHKSAEVFVNSISELTNTENTNKLVYKSDAIYTAEGTIGELIVNDEQLNSLSIYPLPAANNTVVNYCPSSNNINIKLYDMSGSEVFTTDFNTNPNKTNRINIDLSKVNNGVYSLLIIDGTKTVQSRLVVLK